MPDLVGNPYDRFSHDVAHFQVHIGQYVEEEMKKYHHQTAVNEYNTTQDHTGISSHRSHSRLYGGNQNAALNNTTQDNTDFGSYVGNQNAAINEYNTRHENTDISSDGGHNMFPSVPQDADLNNTTQENTDISHHRSHKRSNGGNQSATVNECNTFENTDTNSYSGHYSFPNSQQQNVVSEFNSTPQNEDLIFHNDHYSDVNGFNTAPDGTRLYGHHKSKSESHFDFLLAKRK